MSDARSNINCVMLQAQLSTLLWGERDRQTLPTLQQDCGSIYLEGKPPHCTRLGNMPELYQGTLPLEARLYAAQVLNEDENQRDEIIRRIKQWLETQPTLRARSDMNLKKTVWTYLAWSL
uniref:Uncharacterized protein n=1 Tax=Timema bartmani TaxID=61472 RepID=A0A7R9FCN5_9NEOP|nr:unnamed protein product [Timema bartmani]